MDSSVVFAALGDTLDNVAVRIVLVIGLAALAHIIVRTFIGRAVGRAVRGHKFKRRIDEEKREKTLTKVFRTASAVVIWVTVPFVIMWQLQVDLTALITGAGLIGIIVGFGAQSAIKDFLGGIFVLAENQYRVGDIVTLRSGGAELTGLVEDITIRITRLRDLDGNLHIVQNGTVASITNLSFGFANVNVDVRVAYDTDIDKVEKAMNDVGKKLADDSAWSEHIEEPIQFYRVDGFEDSGVRVKALGQVEPAMQWDVAGEFRRRLKVEFEKQDIVIPYPQIVVHNNNRER